MEHFPIGAILVLAVSFITSGMDQNKNMIRQPHASLQKGQVEQGLIKLSREWGEALIKGDATVLDRILANDFINHDGKGGFGNKAQAIAALSQVKLNTLTSENVSVRVYGDTAVVANRGTAKGTFMGKNVSGDYLQIETWVKRDGRWQVVAALWTVVRQGTDSN